MAESLSQPDSQLLHVVTMDCIHFKGGECVLAYGTCNYTPTDKEKKQYCQNTSATTGFLACPRAKMYYVYLNARVSGKI
jgi:hypothetical protein